MCVGRAWLCNCVYVYAFACYAPRLHVKAAQVAGMHYHTLESYKQTVAAVCVVLLLFVLLLFCRLAASRR